MNRPETAGTLRQVHPTAPILDVKGVNLRFGGVRALSDASMHVGQDEMVAVIGPNGAGKTSLLNSLSGFYRPQDGEITLFGESILGMAPHRIAKAGMVRTFQGIHVLSTLSVIENIMLGCGFNARSTLFESFFYHVLTWREEMALRAKAEEIADFLDLGLVRHQPVGTLGYGLRKRVDLGRALALEPKILLVDEPMAGMNGEEKEDLARFLVDIRELWKIPIVMVEHDMSVVMDLADRIYVLNFGQVLAHGKPAEIQTNQDVIRAYLGGSYRAGGAA
ncbi:MAG: ABC transporter ATP-binding protein [Reyranella sp.]|uniref:ABC transporter ATP-binding protein n=1 Tax=Reyranella sp. TaxID=1929291 RepID=UPI00121918BF|nr:ABC transporter ATP-binding protein [Reyranella sp.]TAJ97836.1 MAG: ABC transporter ATP-binding protein [Reyranella sp.]TBR27709.1 MAG: ABC transporter ATP-binding protein [Reyranella sp.]